MHLPAQPLIAVRLERTRDVLRELLHSLRRALPIMVGVAGPIFVASLALLAWAGVPPMKAVTLPWRPGLALWLAQAVLAAWPLWALRRRLLPEAWCVQLRCLPLAGRTLWASDLAVSATILAPLAGLYGVSVVAFWMQRPAWWLAARPLALASLAASWGLSCALGAAALAWQRRVPLAHARRRGARAAAAGELLARRPGTAAAVLWRPWWREAMSPGGPSLAAGGLVALALAGAWVGGLWPAIPGAVWALAFAGLLVALTERAQRASEAHLERLRPWLASLPTTLAWEFRARFVVALPMTLAALAVLVAVLAWRPGRALPLAGFELALLATPWALTAVPAADRETHVGLWAVAVGLLTALGSELWN